MPFCVGEVQRVAGEEAGADRDRRAGQLAAAVDIAHRQGRIERHRACRRR